MFQTSRLRHAHLTRPPLLVCVLPALQELQAQLTQRADQYHRLLDQGESMLLARGGEEAGPGTTQTQQNLAMLQNKWGSLNTKIDDRRVGPCGYMFLPCLIFMQVCC